MPGNKDGGRERNPFRDDPAEDPLFDTSDDGERIIRRPELLRVGFVPEDEDRIVGRDKKMKRVAEAIGSVVRDKPPSDIGIYGKTGTGKSLVARHVMRRSERTARHNDVPVATVYIDCSDSPTKTKVTKAIARKLDREYFDGDIGVPTRGIGSDDYLDIIYNNILTEFNHAIVILDEVDMLREVRRENDESVLNSLSRAEENQFTDCNVGIITISNKIKFKSRLSERVDSSLRQQELIFEPYNATQLQNILKNRRDAFFEGAISTATIRKCAALSAQEHGDARKALVVLKAAAESAERHGATRVTPEHVEDAAEYAEIDRVKELLRTDTPQAQTILYALAALTLANPETESFTVKEIRRQYEDVCERLGRDPLSYNRVYSILSEREFLEIIDSEKGGADDKYRVRHMLTIDPEVVIKAISEENSRFKNRLKSPEELIS